MIGFIKIRGLDNTNHQFDIKTGRVFDDFVDFIPIIHPRRRFDILPVDLLAYPIKAGNLGERHDAITIGIKQVRDHPKLNFIDAGIRTQRGEL